MTKKLTYEFVKESFEREGYKLLSKEYINNREKLNFVCENGHKHSINWGSWNNGIRCFYCSHGVLSTEEVSYKLREEGYKLLSNDYKNNRSLIKYECPNGHIHSVIWYSWINGKRCPYCSKKAKKTIEEIRISFEKEGYTLLSKKYKNNLTKLDYICPLGHKHSMCWAHWEGHKRRCPTCAVINKCGPGAPNWKGGISYEPYCPIWKDKEYKQDIRNRDGNRCSNPYCTSNKPNDLTIHHIDYDKKNCAPSNLITVCRSCNSKANTDRGWHKSWYKAILYRRYNI
jgi:hypothetical protein